MRIFSVIIGAASAAAFFTGQPAACAALGAAAAGLFLFALVREDLDKMDV